MIIRNIILFFLIGSFLFVFANKTETDRITDSGDFIPPYTGKYQSILDSIKDRGNDEMLYNSGYFLFDITGDSIPELWISAGTCEADTELKAYTIFHGKVGLIYTGAGGHSDYFIYNGQLVCVMCNTGEGWVITYDYDGKYVTDSRVKFSTWNENGKALSETNDPITDVKLKYWEDNYGKFIELKPLR